MRIAAISLLAVPALLFCPAPAAAAEPKVLVEFFFSAGCDECRAVNEEVIPELLGRLGESVDLRAYDIGAESNLLHMIRLQDALKIKDNHPVSFFLEQRVHIGGLADIRRRLIPEVENMVIEAAERPAGGAADAGAGPGNADEGHAAAVKRLDSLSVGVIMAGGLADGFNPCAFATLIFFITLLGVSGRRGRDLIFVGLGFTAAVFATYFALGLGVFHLLRTLSVHVFLRGAIRIIMLAALAVLAALSFRDAWLFRRTGSAGAMTLQLPDRVKRLIHRVMRANMPARHLVLGSFAIGFLVTLLESACTGQALVPTLAYLASRAGENRSRALWLLALYNVMFVLPHFAVFLAAYHGATNERFIAWSRRNAFWGKLMAGLFFAGLALAMLRM